MNATKWPSLTEFAKHLGREGICRVEETDKGLHIAWIDDSPEALRRKDALRRKEAQDQGDEEREQRMIREQIKRAQAAAGGAKDGDEDEDEEEKEKRELRRDGNEKIALSFGSRKTEGATGEKTADAGTDAETNQAEGAQADKAAPAKPTGFGGISMKLGGKPTTKNVFSQKKNALGGGPKKVGGFEQPKKMSEAERIMKEEVERKRSRESAGFGMPKSKKPRQDG